MRPHEWTASCALRLGQAVPRFNKQDACKLVAAAYSLRAGMSASPCSAILVRISRAHSIENARQSDHPPPIVVQEATSNDMQVRRHFQTL